MAILKVKTDKEFNGFISYLKDKNKQEERKSIYAGLDNNLLIGKAQFITEQTNEYIGNLMSAVLDDAENGLAGSDEDVDNKVVANIIKLQNVIAKLKAVLPEEQQSTILDKTLGFYDNEDVDNAKDCLEAILSFKSGRADCTKKIFDIIIKDIEINKYVDVDNFNRELEKPEALKLISSDKKNKNKDNNREENSNSVSLLLSVLNEQTKGLNTENLAKMYAYINSGWAGVDLGSLTEDKSAETEACHKESQNADMLFNILRDIKDNPDDKLYLSGITNLSQLNDKPGSQGDWVDTYDKVHARKAMLNKAWVDRLREVTVDITLSNVKGTVKTTKSTISNDKFSAAGQPDIVIQKYKSNDLIAVNATALKNLSFNADSASGSSILRHAYAVKKLSGSLVADLGVDNKNITREEGYNIREYKFNITKIGAVEYNLFGLSCVTDVNDKDVLGMFKSNKDKKSQSIGVKPLSQKEIETINTHHLIERVLDYSHTGFKESNKGREAAEIKMAVLDIANFVTLGSRQNILGKVNVSGTFEERMASFTNDFLVQYFKQATDLITSRTLCDAKVFGFKGSSDAELKQNILPFVIKFSKSLIMDGSTWRSHLNTNSKMELVDTIEKLISAIPKSHKNYEGDIDIKEYPFLDDENVRGNMNVLVNYFKVFKKELNNSLSKTEKTNKITAKINGLMKKIVTAKIVPNIDDDISDISDDVINKVVAKKSKNKNQG